MKLYKQTICTFCLLLISVAMMTQNYKVVTVTSFGELQDSLGDDWDKIDSIVVTGTINKTDFRTLYDCSRLGKLTVINLQNANVENNKIPDFALYYPQIMYDYFDIQRIILPENITEIGEYAFSRMHLKKINFPTSLKKFSRASFRSCHWMEMDPLVIPEGITEIPWECFAHCQSFKELILPASLKMVGGFSFCNTRMEKMNLPEGLDSIADAAFWGAGELKKVIIPESAIHLGMQVFAQNDSLHSIKLPQNITKIPDLFLAYNITIDTINIPDNVTVIGANAFMFDFNIKYVHFPKKLKRVEFDAFCQNRITEIVFPETIEFIGKGAFSDSYLLKRVFCPSPIPPIAELDTRSENNSWPFTYINKVTLYVPKGSRELYCNADCWKDFDHIVETDNFPSSCGITFAPDCKVTSSNGLITINNQTNTPLQIMVYTINGNLIREENVVGKNGIQVPPGVYLVKTGNKTHKVIVE